MIKRWLPSLILLVFLGVLVFGYTFITTDLPGRFYTPDQRRVVEINERMNLAQTPLELSYVTYEADSAGNVLPVSTSAKGMGAQACRVRATLDAGYEEIEGVTTTLYNLDFEGTYHLAYSGPAPTSTLEIVFPFPEGLDTLNDVYLLVDGEEPASVQYSLSGITWHTEMAAGDELDVVVSYRARGVGSFRYALDRNHRQDLDVEIAVRGLMGSQVPDDSLPTSRVADGEDTEKFVWDYDALIADRDLQVKLPVQLGFVQRVEGLQEPLRKLSLASPLIVALFVGCLVGVHYLTGVQLPSQHYLLAGLGFFLFYPALTFLSGVIDLPVAAAVAMAAITVLLFTFLGQAAGWRRTWWQTLLLCGGFLGLFSLGAMSHLSGLLFTAGGLLLVGLFMQLVARRRASGRMGE